MNKQALLMKYHPAKKEVEFHRFQNGHEVAIRNDSYLKYYMDQKGTFVLQDHGNVFFDHIAKAFDGLKTVDLQVVTTRLDYEDLVQMTEYYNAQPAGCKMNPTLLAELPDMVQTFTEVRRYGEEAAGILESHRHKLFEIPLRCELVKERANAFSAEMDAEIKNIKEKMGSMSDNHVSLCFTGVYSSGKSALINALLGFRILPENINSETAKMFRIQSPPLGEPVKVCFEIGGTHSELEWDEPAQCFEFSEGPSESGVRTEIQTRMNAVREAGEPRHRQIYLILEHLNKCETVSSEITVMFPIPLDNERVQFTIYDTPGTDSNYLEHQQVLNRALEAQHQSILIFVAKPDGLEGEGNNALLNYIKHAEEKDSKTTIDLGRSLFVINKADTVAAGDRNSLQQREIKNRDDESFSIKLSDKKLFFVSARYAYAAKSVTAGIATQEDQSYADAGKVTLSSELFPMGFCYRQNKCATSEYATQEMLARCDSAVKEAEAQGDETQKLLICAGLYALEKEILQYGEKYAAAVKAFAIIDSVDRALSKLSDRANSLKESNREQIHVIERNIRELEETIHAAIDAEYQKIAIPAGQPLPANICKRLMLDEKTLQRSIVGHTKDRINDKLKGWFFGLGKVHVSKKDKNKVRDIISNVLNQFTGNFLSTREQLLQQQRDAFMEAVKATIRKNGDISETAKSYFLNIPTHSLPKLDAAQNVDGIYNAHKRTDKILWIDVEYLDKKAFVRDIEARMTKAAEQICDDYSRDYRDALETLLCKIRNEYETNLNEYSRNMKAMIEDKDAMIQLGGKVADAAQALSACQDGLNDIIWKEAGHV